MTAVRVVLLWLVCGAPVFAAEARGFVQAQGCADSTGYRLQFDKLDGNRLATPIALNVPQNYYWDILVDEKDPWKVSSPECSAKSPCEPDVHGTVRIRAVQRRFSLRWRARIISGISGEFSVELHDGRKIEGTFHAKVRNPVRKIICE